MSESYEPSQAVVHMNVKALMQLCFFIPETSICVRQMSTKELQEKHKTMYYNISVKNIMIATDKYVFVQPMFFHEYSHTLFCGDVRQIPISEWRAEMESIENVTSLPMLLNPAGINPRINPENN